MAAHASLAQGGETPEQASPAASSTTTGVRTQIRLDHDHPFNPENPSYAPQVRANKEEGNCVVRVMVDVSGRIRALQLLVSSGFPHIDAACLMAGAGGRLLPATLNGRPAVGWANIPVAWHLDPGNRAYPHMSIPESVPRIADDVELPVGPSFYPDSARAKGEEGDCIVALRINEGGAVDGARVLKPTGSSALDQACIEAPTHVLFAPGKTDGRATNAIISLAMYWRLK